jgi:hypothetical protein
MLNKDIIAVYPQTCTKYLLTTCINHHFKYTPPHLLILIKILHKLLEILDSNLPY